MHYAGEFLAFIVTETAQTKLRKTKGKWENNLLASCLSLPLTSFSKGGSIEPKEPPLDPPLLSYIQVLDFALEYIFTDHIVADLCAYADWLKVHVAQLSMQLSMRKSKKQKRSMTLAQEKGASSWLTSLPIEEYSFALHKGAFHDALALRYNWQPIRTPLLCGCGAKFSVEHILSCPKDGFPSLRHNEIRDLTANLLTEVTCAATSVLNQSCNLSLEQCSEVLLLTLSQVQDWTSLQMCSGEDASKKHI